MSEVHTIYDRAAKRCLSLSKETTIMLINGLYEKEYPLDSEVEYHWTEHHDDDLKKTLADTIIRIAHTDRYHIEIQMYPDEDIVLRVFEYGFGNALVNRDGKEILVFPKPKILYLYEDGGVPDVQELAIDFGGGELYTYRVPVVKYLKMDMEEVNRKKLIVLLPFQLLRLRKVIEKERTEETMEQLKYLICHDIIKTIEVNVSAGNITASVGRKLKRITLQLYRHIYEKYDEIERAGVNQFVEEALILDIDVIEAEQLKRLNELEAAYEARVAELETDHEARVAELKTDHEARIAELKTDHETEVLELKRSQEIAKSVLNGTIDQLMKRLRDLGISEEEIQAMIEKSAE